MATDCTDWLLGRSRSQDARRALASHEPLQAEPDAIQQHLAQHSSARVSWWVGSRRRPSRQLARLLLAGDLCELGAAELALDNAELEQLLSERKGLRNPDGRELLEQTGGWYAAAGCACWKPPTLVFASESRAAP